MRVVPDKDDSDRVHISITLSQASSQQASSTKVAEKRVADEDLAATWLLFYPWAKYTGKRTLVGHRYTTFSCCLENSPGVSKYGKGEGQWWQTRAPDPIKTALVVGHLQWKVRSI